MSREGMEAQGIVERVAREMAAKEGWRWDDERQMLDCAGAGLQNTNRERDTWRNRARTAIKAMREPSLAMRHAGHFELFEVEWPAIIDAAINDHEDR